MNSLRFLGISGSLRRQARNSGLLRAAQTSVPPNVNMETANLADVPLYNADIPREDIPSSVQVIFDQMHNAHALVLACPEYNYSLAPALKNILDWASREPDNHLLAGKPLAIMGAGGGMGTSRAQHHLRQVCVFLDMHPLNRPEVFSNAFGPGFNEHGDPVDDTLVGLIGEQMQALADWTLRLGT